MSGGRSALVLLAVATVLLAPSLIFGNLISHSSPHNLTWAAQFADQFRAGILYPRVMSDSFDGLGGPTFYYYAPLGFWVDAVLSVVTFDLLSVSYRLSLSSLLLLWASGLAMRAWLKAEATSPRVALYGALAYMAAPYHLVDHYYRGAYSEFAAYAVLPLVAWGVHRMAANQRFGVALFAGAYAALAMAHVPVALLFSLTALPTYVLYRGWRLGEPKSAMRFFGRSGLGGALGLGIAAIYLLPALTLQGWIPAETFWTGDYRIEKWFLLAFRPRDMNLVIASSALAYAIAATGVVATVARRDGQAGWRSEPVFWALVCLVCIALITGVLPWFWQLPFVAKVQFPWRLMIVVDFAAITALCLTPWPARSRAVSYMFIAVIVAFVPGIGEMGAGILHRVKVSVAQADLPADLKHFLPARYPQKSSGDYEELSLGPLEGTPTISCAPNPRICRATDGPFGALSVDIDSDAPTTVVLRRFLFPYWRLDPALPLVATEPLQLVSFVAPAGRNTYRLQRTAVREERISWAISGLSLVLLLVWTALEWRIRRHDPASPHA
ncbi:MAG: hypothetical protein K2Y40_21935 [Reyranella sp.]|nr:hypothetical protein [Reyranella sp.]